MKKSFIWYVCKVFRKVSISYPLIRTRTYDMKLRPQTKFDQNITISKNLGGWYGYNSWVCISVISFYLFTAQQMLGSNKMQYTLP